MIKTNYNQIEVQDEYNQGYLENINNHETVIINERSKEKQRESTHEIDYEYYTKLLRKKLIEKTLTMERIIKKWDKDYGNFT